MTMLRLLVVVAATGLLVAACSGEKQPVDKDDNVDRVAEKDKSKPPLKVEKSKALKDTPKKEAAQPEERPAEEAKPAADEPAEEGKIADDETGEATPEVGEVKLEESEGLKITSMVLGNGVEKIDGKKKPLNPGQKFSLADTEKVIAFMVVENPEETEAELTVSFAPPGGGVERGKVSVSIPAKPKWSTRAFYRTKGPAGVWTIVVRNADAVIARAPFELTE